MHVRPNCSVLTLFFSCCPLPYLIISYFSVSFSLSLANWDNICFSFSFNSLLSLNERLSFFLPDTLGCGRIISSPYAITIRLWFPSFTAPNCEWVENKRRRRNENKKDQPKWKKWRNAVEIAISKWWQWICWYTFSAISPASPLLLFIHSLYSPRQNRILLSVFLSNVQKRNGELANNYSRNFLCGNFFELISSVVGSFSFFSEHELFMVNFFFLKWRTKSCSTHTDNYDFLRSAFHFARHLCTFQWIYDQNNFRYRDKMA